MNKRPETLSSGLSTASQLRRDRIIDCGLEHPDLESIETAVTFLTDICNALSTRAGWWNDIKTGKALPRTGESFGMKVALIHSELSEALEGNRKNLNDDKLPQYKMEVVEFADALIRIFDTAGGFGYSNLGQAFAEKLAYNANREDHKVTNRNKPGGKKY